jgi:hypothetical protein
VQVDYVRVYNPVAPTVPTVTVSPAVTNVQCGSGVTLTANATGTAPLGYQWYDNQTNTIAGATSATLVLTNLHVAQAGNYTVIVTNAAGAATNADTVNIVDTTPPVITSSFGSLTVNANAQCQAFMPNVTGTNYIVAYDTCSGSVSITQTPTNNAVLALGTNVVVLAVADGNGNTAYSTNAVVVRDTNAPTITVLGANPMTVECHGSYVDPGATATDSCSVVVSFITTNAVNPNVPGPYAVTYVATDAAGNSATNTRTVNVVDTTPPVITWSFTNLTLSANAQCQALMPNVTGTNYILASDACSASVSITQTPTNNAVLALGTNVVVLAVADGNGNTAYSTNAVLVADTTAPAITFCVPAQSLTNGPGCQVALPDYTSLLLATDNCSTNLTVVQVPAPASSLSVGGYTLSFYVDDGNGNTNSCSALVTVYDGVVPTISSQPSSQTSNLGSNVTFTVSATACTALSYQWYFNTNSALANQTNSTLTIASVAATNAGSYSVLITSAGGQTNSQAAVLTVVGQPQPPVLLTGQVLSDKTFQLTLNGPSNGTYRVLASTNVTVAMSNWVALITNTFPGVQTNYTDSAATNYRSRVYRVQSPVP